MFLPFTRLVSAKRISPRIKEVARVEANGRAVWARWLQPEPPHDAIRKGQRIPQEPPPRSTGTLEIDLAAAESARFEVTPWNQ